MLRCWYTKQYIDRQRLCNATIVRIRMDQQTTIVKIYKIIHLAKTPDYNQLFHNY